LPQQDPDAGSSRVAASMPKSVDAKGDVWHFIKAARWQLHLTDSV